MKEVTVTPLCPNHSGRVIATVEHTLTLDDGTPTVVDMCDECEAAITKLIVLLIEDGTPVEPKQKGRKPPGRKPMEGSNEPRNCKVCGTTQPNRRAENSHVRKVHGMTRPEYDSQVATVGPTE